MKYRSNPKKQDLAYSLHLSTETKKRLENAIQKIFDKVHNSSQPDFSIDEMNELIAPYIKTPEEAYFCAQTLVASVISAQSQGMINNKNLTVN